MYDKSENARVCANWQWTFAHTCGFSLNNIMSEKWNLIRKRKTQSKVFGDNCDHKPSTKMKLFWRYSLHFFRLIWHLLFIRILFIIGDSWYRMSYQCYSVTGMVFFRCYGLCPPIQQINKGPQQQILLAPCWPNVDPVGSTLCQRRPNVPCYLGWYSYITSHVPGTQQLFYILLWIYIWRYLFWPKKISPYVYP